MKTINQIKDEKQERMNELIKNCGVFFAFNNNQFDKNKTPLKEGEKYVILGMGGYIPHSQVKNFTEGMKELELWYKNELKENKARRANIVFELANHEAFYTCSINSTMDALGDDYTREEVSKIFNEERAAYNYNE